MLDHDSPYDDRSPDLIARIRKMREAAERRMNAFGNFADYDVRRVLGQKAHASEQRSAEAASVSPQQSSKTLQLSVARPTSGKSKTAQPVLEFPLQSESPDGPEGA